MAISAMIMPLKNWQVSLKSCIRSRCRKAERPLTTWVLFPVALLLIPLPQEASMLYEFRSDRKVNLAYMEEKFEAAVNEAKAAGLNITYEILGIRPCSGDVDKERQAHLLERAKAAVETVTGICPGVGSGSTDCNIPLSMGIPSVCVAATVEPALIQERNM